MKKTVLKYLTLIITLGAASLVFFHWFNVSIPGLDPEGHSFVTIPDLLKDAAGVVSGYAGRSTAAMILVLGGILEYMCVLSAGLSVCGIWKNCIKERKSRFIFSAQVIALCLHFLAMLVMIGANVLVNSIIGINNLLMPTPWFVLSVVFSAGALISLTFYNRELE